MDDEKPIGYEFNGIKFYKEGGRLESELGISFLQTGDANILFDLIEQKTIKKLESSEKKRDGIKNIHLEQAILRIRRILWDEGTEPKLIKTIKKEFKGYEFIADAKPLFINPPKPAAEEDLKTFGSWLRGSGKTIKWILFACVVLTFIGSFAFPFGAANKSNAALLQCFTILFALIYARKKYRPKKFPSSGSENIDYKVNSALGIITNRWLWLFFVWFLLYLFLFFSYTEPSLKFSEKISLDSKQFTFAVDLITTTFNYINTMLIVYCFTYLNEQGEKGKESRRDRWIYLSALFVFWIVTFFVYTISWQNEGIKIMLDLFTGIVAGIAMALFVGRLQSKFLGARPLLLIFLYSYTALQPLYFYLTNYSGWTTGVVLLINLYLILKCLLYLYMAWLFESTRLAFYLVEIRKKHKDIETSWEIWLDKLKQISKKS